MNDPRKPYLKRKKENEEDEKRTLKKTKLSKSESDESIKVEKKLKTETEKKTRKPKASKSESVENETYAPFWSEYELLADQHGITVTAAKNVVELFEDGNTIPFIARYRRDITNNMTPEDLRAAKETYEEITNLKHKMITVLKNLEKSQVLTEEVKRAVASSTSLEELEYVYAPFKPGRKRTLAERAKELGLEQPALTLLQNKSRINLSDCITAETELSDVASVEKGIVHVIAAIIAADTEILSSLKETRKRTNFIIKSSKASSKKDVETKENNQFKFDNYFDFEIPVKYIKPHQVLAINRGENLKILSVKIIVPDSFFQDFKRLCFNKWLYTGKENYSIREKIIREAVEDSYHRLVEPLIKRETRSELKQKAERASCEVFSTNLKQLLLATPLKGKTILGIDPGYSNGCKLAVISSMGTFLAGDVIYPHRKNSEKDVMTFKNLLFKYNCDLIALGNGTACRQTEEWLTDLIQKKTFHPLDIKYTIVREDGASIYSCSPLAKKEFPTLDPNIISSSKYDISKKWRPGGDPFNYFLCALVSVSLARRIQEPLAELIKVEPKHLGIGMYQHDVKKKQLDEALNDVISECVSFVGVDLNTASHCLLRHVAGLSDKRVQQIIDYKNNNGPFICRKQLLEVFGIGQKVFLQCAGFLRVGPLNNEESISFYKSAKATKLDCTNIHPESYDVALKIIKKFNLKLCNIGEPHFISVVKDTAPRLKLSDLSTELKSNEQTIQLILDALSKPLNYDFRNDCPAEPIFKKGLTSINDISSGSVLTGVVNNVTHFGCFVDIGVGSNGLIHVSKYNGLNPQIGNKIEVKVTNVEIGKKRIALQAIKML